MEEYINKFGNALVNTWTNSLDKIYASQKEVENHLLQVFEAQKETWEKVTGELSRIEEEQKKVVGELREYVKQNIQKLYGDEASNSFEQWNAQFDEVSSRVQQLAITPYKENLNRLNVEETIKNGIDQQQKIHEDFLNQLKTAQKDVIDLFKTNTKMALSLYK